MLRMTAMASSEVRQPCSPVFGLRTRNCECWPPRQWIVRTTSRVASSTSAMMSTTSSAQQSLSRARGHAGAFQAASRSSASPIKSGTGVTGWRINRRIQSRFARLHAMQCRLPALLELCGDQAILGIAGSVSPLGEATLHSALAADPVPRCAVVPLAFACIRSACKAASIASGSTARSKLRPRSPHRRGGHRSSCSAAAPE